MSRFEEQISVDVPVRIAYDRWTQFEDFPSFMDGIERVEQLDDKTLRWTAKIGGVTKTWTAEIVYQVPDTRLAWKSIEGAENAGNVLFRAEQPDRTEITLEIDAEPDGTIESVGDALGFLQRRVAGDLQRFKELVERGGDSTGWRGEIHGDDVSPDPTEVPAAHVRSS